MGSHTRPPAERGGSLSLAWTPFRVGWAVIILVTLSVRLYTLSKWSWFQDDYLFVSNVDRMPFLDYVFQDYNSHLQPGQFLVVWLVTRLDPLNFGLATAATCLFAVTALVAWGLALREIFGERLHLLAALLLLGLSPTLVSVSLWWAAALSVYTLYTFMGLSVWFMARFLLRDQRRRDLVGLTASYALGLFFWEKALLVSVPLFFLVCLLGPTDRRDAIRLAVRSLLPAAVISVAYVLVYVIVPRPGAVSDVTPPRGRGVGEAAEFYVRGILDVLLPSLLGGPFNTLSTANGTYEPSSGAVSLVLWGLTVLALVLGILYRRRGWVAVLMSASYAMVSWGLILFSYRYDESGTFAIRAGRYTTDLLPVALLTVMFLISVDRASTKVEAMRRPVGDDAARWVGRARLGYLGLVTVVALVLTGRTWDSTAPSSPEPYFSALSSDARALPDGATLLDNPTPSQVLEPLVFGAAARQSYVLEPLDLPIGFDRPTEQLIVADLSGHLYNGEITNPAATSPSPGPDEGCGYAVRPSRTTTIPLSGELFDFGWIVEISYFVASDAEVEVLVGDTTVPALLTAPPAGVVRRTQLYVSDAISDVQIQQTEGEDPICVTDVRIGELVPSGQRPRGLAPVG